MESSGQPGGCARWRSAWPIFALLAAFPGAPRAAGEEGDKPAAEGRNVGAGEQGFVALIVDGPPIKSDQVKSANHRPYSRGMTCAECHTSTFDFVSTASVQWANNFPQLTQDEIWAKVVAFLPGRERFALASVRNNQPTATTVDMVLDKEDRVFYVVSEVGTEKLLEIRENPAISAVRFEGWTVAEGGAEAMAERTDQGHRRVDPLV